MSVHIPAHTCDVFFNISGACRRRTPRTRVDLKAPKDASHRGLFDAALRSDLAPRHSPLVCAEKLLRIHVHAHGSTYARSCATSSRHMSVHMSIQHAYAHACTHLHTRAHAHVDRGICMCAYTHFYMPVYAHVRGTIAASSTTATLLRCQQYYSGQHCFGANTALVPNTASMPTVL